MWCFRGLVCLLSALVAVGDPTASPPTAYLVHGAREIASVNDVYVCATAAAPTCTGIRSSHILSSTHIMVGKDVQKRWFIAANGSGDGDLTYLYGAVELSASPWVLKSWKRIGGSTWDAGMALKALTSASCRDDNELLPHCTVHASFVAALRALLVVDVAAARRHLLDIAPAGAGSPSGLVDGLLTLLAAMETGESAAASEGLVGACAFLQRWQDVPAVATLGGAVSGGGEDPVRDALHPYLIQSLSNPIPI